MKINQAIEPASILAIMDTRGNIDESLRDITHTQHQENLIT